MANNFNNPLLPYNQDYWSLANPSDRYNIYDNYQQLGGYIPTGNTRNAINNNLLQAYAQNLVGNNNYYNLQDMLRNVYGY